MDAKKLVGYVGTYSSPASKGIYRFRLDLETGQMDGWQLHAQAAGAIYVSLNAGAMAAPLAKDGKFGICLLDARTGGTMERVEVFEEKRAVPCHVAQDGDYVYTANYHEGNAMVYRKEGGGLRLVKRLDTQDKGGCHQVLLHQHYMLVPCLMLDRIMVYDRDQGFKLAGEVVFPKGTGPRHGVFNQDHSKLYVVSELSNQLFQFRAGEGASFQLEQATSFLPQALSKDVASAAIRLSPDQRFLYVSTRGANLITVFSLEGGRPAQIQQVSTKGDHPRDFAIAPGGRHLLVANRFTGNLVSFSLDPDTGRLGDVQGQLKAPEAVSILFEEV